MFRSRLLINADDFGYNSNVNAAIVSCFQKKLLNSTTIMANMGGFEEAVELAVKYEFKDKVGIHINLTEGKPLTDLSGTGLVDKSGEYIMEAAFNSRIFFSRYIKKKIKAEIRAQYNKLLAFGIQPTHIDSHQHIHILPWFAPLFVELAKEVNQKLRVVTVVKRKNFFFIFYGTCVNMYFRKKGVHHTDKFGNVDYFMNYLYKKKNFEPVFEIMVHPAFKENLLIDYPHNASLEDTLINLQQLYNTKTLNKH
jgi:predicted glycoside hydrolase/deacetylase ChbG (UPF0249 family)